MLERDEERAKLLFTWIQDAISSGQLRDPEVRGVKWFNIEVRSESGQSGHPRINPSKGGLQIDRIIRQIDRMVHRISGWIRHRIERMVLSDG